MSMYALQLSGYGTDPTQPPEPGFQWLRYNDPNGGQARRCPSPAPYGCYMIDGYAWGQIPLETSELRQPPSPEDVCAGAYAQWAQQNPEAAFCMTQEDQHRYYSWCLDAVRNPSRMQTYMAQWAQLVEYRCKGPQQVSPPPQPPTPPPPPPPTKEEQCADNFDQWRAYYPNQAKCLQTGDRERVIQWCAQLSATEATRRIKDLVATRCAPPAPPPTTSTPPTTQRTPPPAPPTPVSPPPSDMSTPIPGGGDAPLPPPTQKLSPLRKWGPIVGIGLLGAIALTLARK